MVWQFRQGWRRILSLLSGTAGSALGRFGVCKSACSPLYLAVFLPSKPGAAVVLVEFCPHLGTGASPQNV